MHTRKLSVYTYHSQISYNKIQRKATFFDFVFFFFVNLQQFVAKQFTSYTEPAEQTAAANKIVCIRCDLSGMRKHMHKHWLTNWLTGKETSNRSTNEWINICEICWSFDLCHTKIVSEPPRCVFECVFYCDVLLETVDVSVSSCYQQGQKY